MLPPGTPIPNSPNLEGKTGAQLHIAALTMPRQHQLHPLPCLRCVEAAVDLIPAMLTEYTFSFDKVKCELDLSTNKRSLAIKKPSAQTLEAMESWSDIAMRTRRGPHASQHDAW